MATELPPYLTKDEVAARYRRSVRSVERDIAAGRFSAVRVGGRTLVPRTEILLNDHHLSAQLSNHGSDHG